MHRGAQLYLGFVFSEFATANQHGPAARLQRMASFIFVVPLHKCAITKAGRAGTRHSSNLIAVPPKRAVHKPQAALVGRLDSPHGGIGTMKGNKLTIRNEQTKGRGVLDHDRAKAIIGSNSQKISIAHAGFGFDELVPDVVTKTKGVENILPIAAANDESLSVG